MSDDLTPHNDESSFEFMLQKLQETVAELETGGITLERSVEIYKQGMGLAEHCDKLLSAAALTVKTVTELSSHETEEDSEL